MLVLVINCGSSSVKYQVFAMDREEILARGIVERIGRDRGRPRFSHEVGGRTWTAEKPAIDDHREALGIIIEALQGDEQGVLSGLDELGAVGHRVVHAGEHFSSAVVVDGDVLQRLEGLCELAPLHNPPNIAGIRACRERMPGIPQVAVFDTAFHQTIPDYAYLYGLPYRYYTEYGVRRYGFHGTSHRYVAQKALEHLDIEEGEARIITCHLGSGASVAAVRGGRSVDTSMGFTPLEGLMMGTRSGDLDPAILPYLHDREGLDWEAASRLLNRESGLLGLSGRSSDVRDIERAMKEGDDRARLSMEVFCYRVKKYIGSYMAVLGGLDALVFTAGIGENSPAVREGVCSGLEDLGIAIDDRANARNGQRPVISPPRAPVKVLVIPTDEELVIAREAREVVVGEGDGGAGAAI